MGSKALPLRDADIFHNLPTFPSDVKGLTAIVTGANGISGFGTMRVLLESPNRWTKIYALSRRPPPPEMMDLLPKEAQNRIEHVASDFLSKPEDIAKAIKDNHVTADVVFFYSYLQPKPREGAPVWSNAEELVETNAGLLRNFLQALDLAHLDPSRILLQTGAKNYGPHLGPFMRPAIESDPRVELEPNFYYPQEDLLFHHCKAHPGTSWNVIRPAWIIGAVNNAQMNVLHPLAVYAAVQARRKLPLKFPGDLSTFLHEHTHSTAMLTGYLSEWAVLEEGCRNQAFNATDTCLFTWARFWPELGRWFGVENVGVPELRDDRFTVIDGGHKPPPLGYGPPARLRFSFSFSQWATDPGNQEAWKAIMSEQGLTHNPFEDIDAHFAFADAATWGLGLNLSMTKARLMGWNGFVDTFESVFMMYEEMGKLGMLPSMVKGVRPKPNI